MVILKRWITAVFACLVGASTAQACLNGLEIKADTVTLNAPSGAASTGPTTVNFQQTYTVPPVILVLPGNNNPDPSTIRVTNITTSSFDVGVSEPEGEDGNSVVESFSYLAIEPGNYTVGGVQFQAGSIATTAYQSQRFGGDSFDTINFSPSFPGGVTPIVVHEIQSFANDPAYNFDGGTLTAPWLETIGLQATASNTSFQVALERAETAAGGTTITAPETIAYLAVEPGTGSFLDGGTTVNFNVFETPDNITGNCTNNAHGVGANAVAISSQSRRDGNNGGWVRQCSIDGTNISMQVDEDRARDNERNHTAEAAGVMAFSQTFAVDLTGSGGPRMEVANATTDPQSGVGGTLNFTNVSFPNAFAQIPLVFALPTTEGVIVPSSLRVRNRTVNGFQIAQIQPEGETGSAPQMTVDYLAIVPGNHTLPDGTTILEAGSINTTAVQGNFVPGNSFATLNFINTFNNPPALLLDVQTTNSEPLINPSAPSIPWLEVAVGNNSITTTGAQVALERSQTDSGTVVAENLAYLATESAQSVVFGAAGNIDVTMKSLLTPININGVDDTPGCYTNTYPGGAFAATPLAVANIASRFGGDGGWMRRCSNSTTQLGLVVDEDRDADTERSHGGTEQASFVAFSEAFEWCSPEVAVDKTSAVERDPINNTSNPKSIPGALVRYSIGLQNQGAPTLTNNSVSITDSIPNGTALFVQTSATFPGAPFIFTDGGVSSGLSFTYGGIADATDDVEFSNNNGVSFTYTPVPDADGVDAAITDVRFSPNGGFLGMSNATDVPSFSIQFGVRVE